MDELNVLIIEDIEFRQELIKKKLELKNATCTKYANIALELIEENSYDLIFLDHDLIGMISGSYFTRIWYENYKRNKSHYKTQKPIVVIHSMNMSGSSKMENYLKGISRITERIPFRLIATDQVDLKEEIEKLLDV